jgi:pimeloyl-ACP methyl ester carboxylesterase
LDLSALVDVIRETPVNLLGHSLGGAICTLYAGTYPDRVRKLVSIEGWGPPDNHPIYKPPAARMRDWIERIRQAEQREPRSYPTIDEAVARMKEANPHLSDEVARHLTVYGTNWRSDGGLTWKFDNFARFLAPYGQQREDYAEICKHIAAPTLLIRGLESWAADPSKDGRADIIRNHRLVNVEGAGHWVHHDRLDVFLAETARFLAE